jgi:WD40 repeat protein
VRALAVLHDGRLACGCDDNFIHIWSLADGQYHKDAVLEGHTNNVLSLAVLPNGLLASGSDDRTVRVWDMVVRPHKCVAVLKGHHRGGVCALAVLPDGRLATGCMVWGFSNDPYIRVWELTAPNSIEDERATHAARNPLTVKHK